MFHRNLYLTFSAFYSYAVTQKTTLQNCYSFKLVCDTELGKATEFIWKKYVHSAYRNCRVKFVFNFSIKLMISI